MSELTYILGAGASFQSMPIVKNFAYRFNEFISYLTTIIDDPRFEPQKRNLFKRLFEVSKKLHNDFETHQSFDTYFKKLFHTKENEKINEAKKILNLYFIWEHLSKETGKPGKYDDLVFWKQSKIDKRYDALIAGLLKPQYGETETYCKVNFITWNYDLNLLSSIKNYFSPSISFEAFLNNITKKDKFWIINDQISVINMNGFFYSSWLKEFKNFNDNSPEYTHHVLYNKMDGDYFDFTHKDDDAELIKFAWETDNLNVQTAKEKIKSSQTIVVIGYTFPLYNRIVEFGYLNRNDLIQKDVIIQDPNAEVIRQNLLDYYLLSDYENYRRTLRVIKDCDSFYVPSNIFGIKDGSGEYTFA